MHTGCRTFVELIHFNKPPLLTCLRGHKSQPQIGKRKYKIVSFTHSVSGCNCRQSCMYCLKNLVLV